MSKKYLYLPLEIVVRELDAKALLACYAALDNWTVVVGQKLELIHAVKQIPKGVFLVKSVTPNEYTTIKKIKDAGHEVFSLDEEGLVTYEEYLRLKIRYDEQIMPLANRIMFWGRLQAECFDDCLPDFSEKAVVVGNPRIEFWKEYNKIVYQDKVQDLKNKYGDFVLFPTSFGIANHFSGKDYGVALIEGTAQKVDTNMQEFIKGIGEHIQETYKFYTDFFGKLANAFPDTNFVIRPHPSEARADWDKIADACNNVKVVFEGAIAPWILASKGVFHYGSTTAIEAYLMDKPVLSYCPPISEHLKAYYRELTQAVSFVTYNEEDTISMLGDILKNKQMSSAKLDEELIGKWLLDDGDETSSQRIMAIIASSTNISSKEELQPIRAPLRTRKNILYPLLKFMNWFYPFKRHSLRLNPENYTLVEYSLRKREGFDIELVDQIISIFKQRNAKKTNALSIESRHLTDSLIVIEQASNDLR